MNTPNDDADQTNTPEEGSPIGGKPSDKAGENCENTEKEDKTEEKNKTEIPKNTENVDETHSIHVPLDETLPPENANDASDPEATIVHQDPPPDQTLDFSVSQSSKFQLNIPGYELIHELGRGAMGVVYKARQIGADRIVALKIMINLDHAKPQDIERFIIEAQSAARLQHPNIIQVYDVSHSGHAPFFTQEFAPGGTLAKKIAKQMLSHADTAKTMLSLANAIAYAHSRQIVHRDLKPLNILLGEHGVPKIADFGLARRMEDQSHLTQDGSILGTPSYMSPEQASGSTHLIGPLSDVYALGAILFELLTGRPPFKGSTVWEVIQQVRTADPSPPSQLQSGIPADLETICLKCLQKDPTKRYESAKHLADDIQRHINHEPILARPIGQWERLVRLCKRNPREARLVGLVASLLACFTVVASYAALRINQDRNQIVKQRDEISDQKNRIEKQRDEIAKEKGISDNRLSLYRTTVSKMVNRLPRLLENGPFGSGTREELLGLVSGVLSGNNDAEVVGASQKWGQMAVAIREGEIALARMLGSQKVYESNADLEAASKMASERFAEAERIGTEVFESDEPDRAKAAANLATAKGRIAAFLFEQDRKTWQRCVPYYKEAQKLRRQALEATPVAGSDPLVMRQVEMANELQRYASFLVLAEGHNPKHISRATEVLEEARSLLKVAIESIADHPDIEETARTALALTESTLANTQLLTGNDSKIRAAFEAAIEQYNSLLAKAPNRYTFQKDISECANAYGDYLLMSHADPKLIERQYRLALDSIKALLLTTEANELERLGLGMGYYRIGLTLLRQNQIEQATQAFTQCEILRAKAYYAREEDLGLHESRKSLLPFRIDWMIVQARLGMEEKTITSIKELLTIANSSTEDNSQFSPASLYKFTAASMGMLSNSLRQSNPSSAEKYQASAMRLLEKALSAGYRDINYLKTDPDFDWLQNEKLLTEVEAMFQKLEVKTQ